MSWKITNLNWTIESLLLNRAAIDLRPEYQRQFVWNDSMMQNLIWCMLRGQDIPKFYFHNRRDMRPRRWDVVDGQQRIETIYRFVDGKFGLSRNSKYFHSKPINGVEVAEKTFTDLSEEMQADLLNYPIIVGEIETNDRDLVIDQFLSLQYGKTLNGQEKRQARPGRIRDLVRDLGGHEFISLAQVNKKREGQFEAVSRLMFWEYNNEITDSSGEALDRFYILHAPDGEQEWSKITNRAYKTLSHLHQALPTHHPRMREAVTFMLIYWLMRHLLMFYVVDEGIISGFSIWFDDFSKELSRNFPQKQWTGASTAGKQNQSRFQYMLDHFLKSFPNLVPKDNQRNFTSEQRRLIWERANGLCQWEEVGGENCDHAMEFETFDADHIIPYSQGGKTSLENGRALCPYRNRSSSKNTICPYKS